MSRHTDDLKYWYLQRRARRSGKWSDKRPDLDWKGALHNRIACIAKTISALDAERYLEIGCETDIVFKSVACSHKVGVDPNRGGTVRATSDDFFAGNDERFDVIFVDGLHEYAQVKRDIDNALSVLNEGGAILIHDCLPLSYAAQAVPRIAGRKEAWTGDVWKAIAELKQRTDVDLRVIATDSGVGLLLPRENTDRKDFGVIDFASLDYRFYLDRHRDFGLIAYSEIDAFLAG